MSHDADRKQAEAVSWESKSLGHHCSVCQKPLSRPAATRCFVDHTRPCFAYHLIAFKKGTQSKCSWCKAEQAQQEKRHVEIKDLIVQMQTDNDDEPVTARQTGRTPLLTRSTISTILCPFYEDNNATEDEIVSCAMSRLATWMPSDDMPSKKVATAKTKLRHLIHEDLLHERAREKSFRARCESFWRWIPAAHAFRTLAPEEGFIVPWQSHEPLPAGDQDFADDQPEAIEEIVPVPRQENDILESVVGDQEGTTTAPSPEPSAEDGHEESDSPAVDVPDVPGRAPSDEHVGAPEIDEAAAKKKAANKAKKARQKAKNKERQGRQNDIKAMNLSEWPLEDTLAYFCELQYEAGDYIYRQFSIFQSLTEEVSDAVAKMLSGAGRLEKKFHHLYYMALCFESMTIHESDWLETLSAHCALCRAYRLSRGVMLLLCLQAWRYGQMDLLKFQLHRNHALFQSTRGSKVWRVWALSTAGHLLRKVPPRPGDRYTGIQLLRWLGALVIVTAKLDHGLVPTAATSMAELRSLGKLLYPSFPFSPEFHPGGSTGLLKDLLQEGGPLIEGFCAADNCVCYTFGPGPTNKEGVSLSADGTGADVQVIRFRGVLAAKDWHDMAVAHKKKGCPDQSQSEESKTPLRQALDHGGEADERLLIVHVKMTTESFNKDVPRYL